MLSSVNSVLSLSLILAQASSPAQAMRLVATAVPSIAASHSAVAWHPSRAGDYYEQAPENAARLLAGLTGAARLEIEGSGRLLGLSHRLAAGPRAGLPDRHRGHRTCRTRRASSCRSSAQLCGTVIANQELIAAERERLTADRRPQRGARGDRLGPGPAHGGPPQPDRSRRHRRSGRNRRDPARPDRLSRCSSWISRATPARRRARARLIDRPGQPGRPGRGTRSSACCARPAARFTTGQAWLMPAMPHGGCPERHRPG